MGGHPPQKGCGRVGGWVFKNGCILARGEVPPTLGGSDAVCLTRCVGGADGGRGTNRATGGLALWRVREAQNSGFPLAGVRRTKWRRGRGPFAREVPADWEWPRCLIPIQRSNQIPLTEGSAWSSPTAPLDCVQRGPANIFFQPATGTPRAILNYRDRAS